MLEGYNVFDFGEAFTCDDDCREFLFNLKWQRGYKCSKCGCTKSWKGRTRFHLRCSKCWYDESVTANTVFHKIKIPLIKAFGMGFRIAYAKKASSCLGLSRDYAVSKDSAWLFKRKTQEAVREGNFSGSPCFHYKKDAILTKRANNKNSVNGSFEKNITETDPETFPGKELSIPRIMSKERMKEFFKNAEINGKNIVAHNFRTWINGIHHHCSERYMSGYLAEYFFRHQHRKQVNIIWHRLIECFVRGKPYYYKSI